VLAGGSSTELYSSMCTLGHGNCSTALLLSTNCFNVLYTFPHTLNPSLVLSIRAWPWRTRERVKGETLGSAEENLIRKVPGECCARLELAFTLSMSP
jgi:hypothetical protein